MDPHSYYEYYSYNGADFFTLVLKPRREGRFPTVITRSPYVGNTVDKTEDELVRSFLADNLCFAENGYVLVFQHCRGQGKSSGAFVPYVHEREDGLALRDWIRKQDFYNGQLLLLGGSYTASLHYSTAPFEEDIKGAVFNVQDSERYRLWYRNGCMRRGHANWHFNLYKSKCGLNKTHSMDSFSERPLRGLSERVLGDRADDFEEMLLAPSFHNSFWKSRHGGCEARDAVTSADIPMLFTTGYNDFYVGGMFRMWEAMDEGTKRKCALLVSPYNHGDTYYKERGIPFDNASVAEQFGKQYRIDWFNAVINNEKPFVETGKVHYYRTFDGRWDPDFYGGQTEELSLTLGVGERGFRYDPDAPTAFAAEGCYMDPPWENGCAVTLYTDAADCDLFIKGRMKACLTVSSSCEDTTFYVAVGIETENGDYMLRHDITSLAYQKGSYTENSTVTLDFTFDEYAFLLKKGRRLRVDVASTDKNTYVCHTNIKGDYSSIGECRIAENRVYLKDSRLILPVEKRDS